MESIFDGTWASGEPPEEFVLARVLDRTGWSWQEWEATPPYIQRIMWDYYNTKDQAEADAREKQETETRQQMPRGR